MVDRIDKPEPITPYHIDEAASARKDKDRDEGQQQRDSDEYSGSHAAPGWQKIYAASSNRRYLKVRREEITRAWYRGTAMQRGISIVEADLEVGRGKIIRAAHIILPAREDFWTLKRFQPGQEIPLNILLKDPVLEISVPAPRTPVNTTLTNEEEAIVGTKDNKKLMIYAALGAAILLIALILLLR
ncbi:MAG: hypothetical protein COV46_00885 [Deltaproteobacteria bacterium CG11_big_fil_rev_8_21_14_0_20_49_13]|nr:MAG: hypothetical protein COV46_00885 [Deltaproteobacteria bacterium CG11_big_fil_rev_8_21_14_0_20_49_13]